MFSPDQAHFSSDPSQILILQYPIPIASCFPRNLCQISTWPTETPLQCNLHHVLHRFLYFFLPHSTTRHNYWIYQTIRQAKRIKFIINHNTLLVKQATYQKAEPLRAPSLSKLDNTVHNNSIFNTRSPEFSTKW